MSEYKGIFNEIGKNKKTDDIMADIKMKNQMLTDIRNKTVS